VGVGAGVLLAGLGAYFLWRGPGEEGGTHQALSFSPLPGGAELQMGGRF